MLDASSPQRVLLVTLSNVGDAVLSLPVLDLVRQRHPEARVSVLAGARSAAVFAGHPWVDDVILDPRPATWSSRRALWRRLRGRRFDTVIDLRRTLWPWLLGARRHAPLWAHPPQALTHRGDRHLWFACRALGAPPEARPTAGPLPRDEAFIAAWWQREGLAEGTRLVAISPGARSHIKRWTSAGFAAVADRLIETAGAHIVFTGEPDEQSVVDDVVARLRRPACPERHLAVGQTTLPQLSALLGRCRLLIANDSAAMHLAWYLGVPVVAIFGPTDPRKYGPRGPRDRVIQQRLHCVPCEASLCRYAHECMEQTSADEVCAAAMTILQGGAAQAV